MNLTKPWQSFPSSESTSLPLIVLCFLEQHANEVGIPRYPEIQHVVRANPPGATSSSHSDRKLAELLSVSLSHLDGDAEMRKFFGAKVIQATKTSSQNQSSRRQNVVSRSNLTRPRATWWAAKHREGLSSRLLEAEEVDDKRRRHGWAALDQTCVGIEGEEKWWTVEYSKKYKAMTRFFLRTVQSGGTSLHTWPCFFPISSALLCRSTGLLGPVGKAPLACGYSSASSRSISP